MVLTSASYQTLIKLFLSFYSRPQMWGFQVNAIAERFGAVAVV
jgi:hypothetical protein